MSLLVLIVPYVAAEEDSLSFATYYPAPYGVYNEMRTNKLVIGDSGASLLSSPDTAGIVKFKGLNSDPFSFNDQAPGSLYYNSFDKKFKYHDGSSWQDLGGGGAGQGGLYGLCIESVTNIWACALPKTYSCSVLSDQCPSRPWACPSYETAQSPAYCDSGSDLCACPAGYTKRMMSKQQFFYMNICSATNEMITYAVTYTCVKN